MAKRTDIKKILIIGSGPIVIGQAAEFDYAGTQACLALKEEGYEVVLCNSNPATIMTDTLIADKVYMEPLTLEYIAKIIRHERPDAIVPGIGGQTGLNLAMQLEKKGILKECRVKLLGTGSESIERAEDREMFKELCQSIGEPTIPSEITYNLDEAKGAAERIGYPVVLRPAFTLGGTGGGFAYNEEELIAQVEHDEKIYKELYAKYGDSKNREEYYLWQNANLKLLGSEDQLGYVRMQKKGIKVELLSDEAPAEIQVIRLGGTLIVGVQGEMFVEYALYIKAVAGFGTVIVNELANGCLPGYLYTPESLVTGGYETDTSMLGENFGKHLVDKALEIINEVK